jgi:hypothetical protein
VWWRHVRHRDWPLLCPHCFTTALPSAVTSAYTSALAATITTTLTSTITASAAPALASTYASTIASSITPATASTFASAPAPAGPSATVSTTRLQQFVLGHYLRRRTASTMLRSNNAWLQLCRVLRTAADHLMPVRRRLSRRG